LEGMRAQTPDDIKKVSVPPKKSKKRDHLGRSKTCQGLQPRKCQSIAPMKRKSKSQDQDEQLIPPSQLPSRPLHHQSASDKTQDPKQTPETSEDRRNHQEDLHIKQHKDHQQREELSPEACMSTMKRIESTLHSRSLSSERSTQNKKSSKGHSGEDHRHQVSKCQQCCNPKSKTILYVRQEEDSSTKKRVYKTPKKVPKHAKEKTWRVKSHQSSKASQVKAGCTPNTEEQDRAERLRSKNSRSTS